MASIKAKNIEEVEDEPKKNRSILTLFILVYPVFLMAVCALLQAHWILQILLFFYEAILIKNFIDDYYSQEV